MTKTDESFNKQGDDFRPLRELLPLDTPLAMSFDTTEVCNIFCKFCIYEQSRRSGLTKSPTRDKPIMDLGLFKKAVQDMKAFPRKVKKVSLHSRGEPLIHPNLVEMTSIMSRAEVADTVKVITNGILLTREKAKALLDAGIGQVIFSVIHVHSEGYREMTDGTWTDYDRVLDNFRMLREERDKGGFSANLSAKILDYLNAEEQAKFKEDFGPLADNLIITGLYGCSKPGEVDSTMGQGQGKGFYGAGVNMDRKVCPQPFFYIYVGIRGNVIPCWVDWSNGGVVGNVATTPLVDIWNGEAMRRFRLSLLEGRRDEIDICKDCQFIFGIHPQSDIDAEAEQLAEIYRHG